MSKEFPQRNKEDIKNDLLLQIPEELRRKHVDNSIEELERFIEERKVIGNAPDIENRLEFDPTSNSLVDKKEAQKERLNNLK